jgi:hypothetical protein
VFTNRRPRDHRCAAAAEIASAPTSNVCTPARSSVSSTLNSDGTTLATSTPADTTRSLNRDGSARWPSSATTTVPPPANVTATSNTEASKLNEANCNTRRPPNNTPNAATRFDTLP